jgi:hypothetical protein
MAKKNKKIELDILQDTAWLEFYQQNPVVAAEDFLVKKGMPLMLPAHQRIILKDLWAGKPFSMLILTRGGGKTALIAIYYCLKGILYPGERLGIISGSFRQAKKTFDEIASFYDESPILRECSTKKPIRPTDECVWEITGNGSIIKALPLGDGQKIRGERFYKIFIDEFPNVDREIFSSVIVPMLATRKNPTLPPSATDERNQLILASTATWQFSWAYRLYNEYKKEMERSNPDYSVYEFDCDDVGDFLDSSIVEYSRKHSPRIVFLMEYKLYWPKDSHGWYPASLIAKCKRDFCLMEKKGKPEESYVMGIDPARESDLFAVAILRLTPNGKRLVYLDAASGATFPEMAQKIRQLKRDFNIVRIAMDYGGGGTAVRDQLATESVWYNPSKKQYIEELPILPIDKSQFPNAVGERILDVVYFSPKEIYQMNADLKSDMEHDRLHLPKEPILNQEWSEEIYEQVTKLEEELRAIETTTTPSGVLHFDTPSKHMIKDRYTSLLLANKAAKDYLQENAADKSEQELATGFWLW